jgi:LDH2 family malate/lactate/ureidoglycolate dehydrogenase
MYVQLASQCCLFVAVQLQFFVNKRVQLQKVSGEIKEVQVVRRTYQDQSNVRMALSNEEDKNTEEKEENAQLRN